MARRRAVPTSSWSADRVATRRAGRRRAACSRAAGARAVIRTDPSERQARVQPRPTPEREPPIQEGGLLVRRARASCPWYRPIISYRRAIGGVTPVSPASILSLEAEEDEPSGRRRANPRRCRGGRRTTLTTCFSARVMPPTTMQSSTPPPRAVPAPSCLARMAAPRTAHRRCPGPPRAEPRLPARRRPVRHSRSLATDPLPLKTGAPKGWRLRPPPTELPLDRARRQF